MGKSFENLTFWPTTVCFGTHWGFARIEIVRVCESQLDQGPARLYDVCGLLARQSMCTRLVICQTT